jgi:large subunit ribosomal protein L18
MNLQKRKSITRWRRSQRVRNRVREGGTRPRLSVFRSAKHIYAQIIDDQSQKTIVAVGTTGKKAEVKNGGNVEGAKQVGKRIAELAIAKGVKEVAFDRGRYRYHGRVKALADAAREAGLKF